MRQKTSIALATILLLFVWACGATTYQLAGKRYPIATIQNPGDLYSTYELSKSDRKELIEQGFKDEMIRNIEKMANEVNWPEGIANIDGRLASRDQLKQYKAFNIARISSGDKVILAIPAASNKKMPKNMRSNQDIFFVIGASGVK